MRCTLTLTASAVTADTAIESSPNPSNNQIVVHVDVTDKSEF